MLKVRVLTVRIARGRQGRFFGFFALVYVFDLALLFTIFYLLALPYSLVHPTMFKVVIVYGIARLLSDVQAVRQTYLRVYGPT